MTMAEFLRVQFLMGKVTTPVLNRLLKHGKISQSEFTYITEEVYNHE